MPGRLVPEALPRVIPEQERMPGNNKKDGVGLPALGNGMVRAGDGGWRMEGFISFMQVFS